MLTKNSISSNLRGDGEVSFAKTASECTAAKFGPTEWDSVARAVMAPGSVAAAGGVRTNDVTRRAALGCLSRTRRRATCRRASTRIHEWLTKKMMKSGDHGLAAAFGPGFSAEVLLLQWN